MTRHLIQLNTRQDRLRAHQGVDRAPAGWTLELREAKRSDEQNRAIHGLCNQVLKRRPIHRGVKMTMEDYKAAFMNLLGSELRFIPTLDGDGYFPMGQSTSKLSVSEFSNLLECALAWCAREQIEIQYFDGDPRSLTDQSHSRGA